jgi:UDP-N-acetyl-D-glucosamine dehydrogenase
VSLETKIENKTAKVAVIGLGYVGLPLAVEYAATGYAVLGIDLSKDKVAKLNRGENYIDDVDGKKLKELVKAGKLSGATNYDRIGDYDVVYICVPTPFTDTKDPDVSYIENSAKGIAKGLRREQLIILKSTTYPETTEKVVQPILEATGLKVGKDFYLAFSPERIDPGNKKFNTATTPIVVGGVTKKCTRLSAAISRKVIVDVRELSSPKAAEMTKLLENIFRSVNIAWKASTSGKWWKPRRQNRSASCRSFPARASAGTAFSSIRIIFPGKPKSLIFTPTLSSWRR